MKSETPGDIISPEEAIITMPDGSLSIFCFLSKFITIEFCIALGTFIIYQSTQAKAVNPVLPTPQYIPQYSPAPPMHGGYPVPIPMQMPAPPPQVFF